MPAHSDSDIGTRFGIGARPAEDDDVDRPPRNDAMTVSSNSDTVSCRNTTALGAPVVPDVNCTIASPASTTRAPGHGWTSNGPPIVTTAPTPVVAIARSTS